MRVDLVISGYGKARRKRVLGNSISSGHAGCCLSRLSSRCSILEEWVTGDNLDEWLSEQEGVLRFSQNSWTGSPVEVPTSGLIL